jgi:quercetin dioxygenase-like cupin family protein
MSANTMAVNSSENTDRLLSGFYDPLIHITTHDAEGKAVIQSSSHGSWESQGDGALGLNVVYSTSSFPVDLNGEKDIKEHLHARDNDGFGIYKARGTICRMPDIAPGCPLLLHRTHSLDIGIVMEGEVEMELDDGRTTLLKRGDMFVQRGAMHGWRPPKEWVRILVFVQPSEPIKINGEVLPEDMGLATGLMKPST